MCVCPEELQPRPFEKCGRCRDRDLLQKRSDWPCPSNEGHLRYALWVTAKVRRRDTDEVRRLEPRDGPILRVEKGGRGISGQLDGTFLHQKFLGK